MDLAGSFELPINESADGEPSSHTLGTNVSPAQLLGLQLPWRGVSIWSGYPRQLVPFREAPVMAPSSLKPEIGSSQPSLGILFFTLNFNILMWRTL